MIMMQIKREQTLEGHPWVGEREGDLAQSFLNFIVRENCLKSQLKHRFPGPTPEILIQQICKICIPDNLPHDN